MNPPVPGLHGFFGIAGWKNPSFHTQWRPLLAGIGVIALADPPKAAKNACLCDRNDPEPKLGASLKFLLPFDLIRRIIEGIESRLGMAKGIITIWRGCLFLPIPLGASGAVARDRVACRIIEIQAAQEETYQISKHLINENNLRLAEPGSWRCRPAAAEERRLGRWGCTDRRERLDRT